MPELPEVETVCRGLGRALAGKTIASIETRRRNLRIPFPKNLARVQKARIKSIERRAKYILMHLSGDMTMIIHLGMSGRMLIRTAGEKSAPEKHDHMILRTSGGTEAVFNDPRRFGLVDLADTRNIDEHRFFRHLGPEPFDKNFNAATLAARLAGKKAPIKIALMDQRIVVGVGNIYAAEALYATGIDPRRPAGKMTKMETKKLVHAVRRVLTRAIRAGGSSLRDYVQTDGELGYFQHAWAVYGRDGEACRACDCKIKKITQGGRSTFYCPSCQS